MKKLLISAALLFNGSVAAFADCQPPASALDFGAAQYYQSCMEDERRTLENNMRRAQEEAAQAREQARQMEHDNFLRQIGPDAVRMPSLR